MISSSLIRAGGPVMWPLLLASLFGFIIFIERALYLHQGQIRTNDFLAGIKNLLRKQRLVEAITVCEETPGPVPGLVKAALLHHDQGEERLRAVLQSAALVEIPTLERRVGSVAAIARIAPLLGLLGTVLGLVKTFRQLGEAGAYAHFGVYSAGLAEALVATATGLVVAILAHLAHHFLAGRVRALVQDMEYAAHDLVQFLTREKTDPVRPPPHGS